MSQLHLKKSMILQKILGFDPKTMRKHTEVVAGATTFLTMCYIGFTKLF